MILGLDALPILVKKSLEDLTMIEEMLVSPLLSIMSIFRLSGGQLISRGFVANFTQDIQPLVNVLPRLPKELPILIIKKKDQKNQTHHFKVNKKRVEIVLKYLCENNEQYKNFGIKISNELIEQLPDDGIPESLNEIDSNDNQINLTDIGPEIQENADQNFDELDDEYQTLIERDFNDPLQVDLIKNAINYPKSNLQPLNEFENDAICSLLFPKLFPNGMGDPTKKSRLKYVSESLAIQHLMKVVSKSSQTGEFYYPVAQHPRFKFWYYDRLRRHRTLDQAKVYIKQNPRDANMTIQELKNMISSGESDSLMKRLSSYSANVTGSDSYWFKRRTELEATMEQGKIATAFFTFSYPDTHWSDLQKLMPGAPAKTYSEKYKKVLENPHLVDWFFGHKLNEFLKVVFDEILQCEWRWHRYEWQSRSSIHAHGAVRFKNAPDLCKLTMLVYQGRMAEEKIKQPSSNFECFVNLKEQIVKGQEAEDAIIKYVDTLVTAMNTRTSYDGPNSAPDPHPCSLNTNRIEASQLDNDYESIINCCQRHVCRKEGYCKSKQSNKNSECRFGYPFVTQEKTKIVFTETKYSVKAEIALMRNDPFMNAHNRLICHHWRGNVDMSIILDKHRATSYMVKYATKGEKAGKALTQTFKDVIGPASLDENPISKLRSIMIKSVAGKRDIGQCEISRLLMSQPLFHSSFNYVTISTDLEKKEINISRNQSPNEPATKKSLIDFYAHRKTNKKLENYLDRINCLITFVQLFQLNAKNELELRKNSEKTIVITYPKFRFNPDNPEMNKYYCFHNMIKYSDWTIENIDDITNIETAINRWQSFLKTASSDFLGIFDFHSELHQQLKEARANGLEEVEEVRVSRDNWMILAEMAPIRDDVDDCDEVVPDREYDWIQHRNNYTLDQIRLIENNWINNQKRLNGDCLESNDVPLVLPFQLNKMQRFAYNLVDYHINNNEQLLLIVNGSAGTGKSYTIYAISKLVDHKIKRSAPTAKAAFLIRGETIHAQFSINPSKCSNLYSPLTGSKLQELQQKFRSTTHIIIDEYSMLSQSNLAIIDKRLRQAKENHGVFFGGISIILVGDPGQLLPVGGAPLYQDLQTKNTESLASLGFICYREFNKMVLLEQIERQKNDENDPKQEYFVQLLSRLRNGISDEKTVDDWKFLMQQKMTPVLLEQFKDAIRLFPENSSCMKYNHEKLKQLKMPICQCKSINNPSSASRYDEDNFFGLKNVVNLSINAKITLTTNLWTEKGLVNGANGVIKDILFSNLNTLPSAILIEFDQYTGPKIFDSNDYRHNWIPINPFDAFCQLNQASRKQYPLRLGYALTIHKSQGQTLSKAVIDLGKKETSLGLTFVALSRLKNYKDLLLYPFTLERLQKISNSKSLQPRLNEEKRTKKIIENTLEKYLNLLD
jgi:hypothetical protein